MYSKMISIRFPKTAVNEPVVVNLVKKFDLTFNILKATIYPRKEGIMKKIIGAIVLAGAMAFFAQPACAWM